MGAIFLTLLGLALAGPPLPLAAQQPLAWQSFSYREPGQADTRGIDGFQCRLKVPQSPTDPSGVQLDLFVVRLPARISNPGPPVVYLHGGPGGSCLDTPGLLPVFEALRGVSDVILFDQRGCGRSLPSLTPSERERPGPETLASRTAFLDHLLRASALVRRRIETTGHDPRRFTILDSVADLEALRRALRTPQIHLFGHSYGTQLAQAYLRAHPGSVSRAILVGSRGMDTTLKRPAEADRFIEEIARSARNSGQAAPAFVDLVGTLRRVLSSADRAPLELLLEDGRGGGVHYRVGGFALRFIVAKFYLNDPDNYRYLPKFLDELDKGRKPWSLIRNLQQILHSPVSFVWFTTDAASGCSPGRRDLIRAEATTSLLGEAVNFPFPEINQAWGMEDLGDAFRRPLSCDVPTLLLVGEADGITPVAQSRELLKGFRYGVLRVVPNAGHLSLFAAGGVAASFAAFLGGQPLPELQAPAPIAFVAPPAQTR